MRLTALLSAIVAAASLLLVACGGGGGGGETNGGQIAESPPEPAIKNGVFKDANVRGLAFVSGSERGVTDAFGRFTCRTGEPVSFAIGRVQLGTTTCTTLIHPPALQGNGDLEDPAALSLARFLMLLDQDGDARNGIFISDALRSMADNWAQIDFRAADLTAQLTSIISDIATIERRIVATPPTASEAYAHMEATLGCAYSGAFVGRVFDGGFEIGSVTLMVARDPDSGGVGFQLERYIRPVNWPAVTLSVRGESPLAAVRRFHDTATWAVSPIHWEYQTADTIFGHWKDALTNTFAGSATDFYLLRLGSDTVEHRFVGRFSGGEVHGLVELGLTGDRVSGTAAVFASNEPLTVNGTVRGAEVDLTIGTETAVATLVRDGTGAPIGLHGRWPGSSSGTFDTIGCRLN